jgi:flavodoxin
MAQIQCIFGSTSGNTELTVDAVANQLAEAGHSVTVKRVENSNINDLTNADLTILGASTYGHGIIQDHFIPFLEAMKKIDLKGKKFAVIGLGDPKYDLQYHIESAKILEAAIKDQGGELICRALRISKSPVPHLNGIIAKWAEDLAKLL